MGSEGAGAGFGDAEVDGWSAGHALGLVALGAEEGEGEVQSLDLTGPAFPFGPVLAGEEYEDELDGLGDWVDDFLLPVYGAEVTTAAPWCPRWQEHDGVVAWLHALRLACQQHKDPEAGLAGMFVWHRDFLTHAMAAVRAPGGPLSACMTSPDRPTHRLLPGPPASARTQENSSAQAEGPAAEPEPDDASGPVS
ncbi:DUF4913 domain-containing protein [Streptomyces niveus]|uniref:DUF4913 domain-containing protein n=1 Tax=Streptomyces niveus TaxID=193462 RepID=UPI003F4D2809